VDLLGLDPLVVADGSAMRTHSFTREAIVKVIADIATEVVREIYNEKDEETLRRILGHSINAHGHCPLHSFDSSRIRLSIKCEAAAIGKLSSCGACAPRFKPSAL
jgi:hypothetical protein